MERMRVVLISLFLFISVVVAEEAGTSETIKPAEDAGIGETVNPAEDAGIGETVNSTVEAGNSETNDLAKHVGISKAINHMLNGQPQAYESPRFKKFVTHCSSHVAQTCSGSDPLHHNGGGINSPSGLALCLSDSMEGCLVDHGASLYQTAPLPEPPKTTKSLQYLPVLIETVKFRTVLRTCSLVSAQRCWNASNVDASVLAACLMPSINQCVYPAQIEPDKNAGGPSPPIRA